MGMSVTRQISAQSHAIPLLLYDLQSTCPVSTKKLHFSSLKSQQINCFIINFILGLLSIYFV